MGEKCSVHDVEICNLKKEIQRLENQIDNFKGDDWSSYKDYINEKVKELQDKVIVIQEAHRDQEKRFAKQEAMFDNMMKKLDELIPKVDKLTESFIEVKTESRLNDQNMERDIEKLESRKDSSEEEPSRLQQLYREVVKSKSVLILVITMAAVILLLAGFSIDQIIAIIQSI